MKLRLETMRDGRIKLKIVRYFRKPDGKSSCTTVKVLGFKDELEKEVGDPIAWGEEVARKMTDDHNARNGHAMVDIDLSNSLKVFKSTPVVHGRDVTRLVCEHLGRHVHERGRKFVEV